MGGLFVLAIAYTIVAFSLADYAQDVGFTAQQASLAAAIFNRKFIHTMLFGRYI